MSSWEQTKAMMTSLLKDDPEAGDIIKQSFKGKMADLLSWRLSKARVTFNARLIRKRGWRSWIRRLRHSHTDVDEACRPRLNEPAILPSEIERRTLQASGNPPNADSY